ncbi:MAG: hypothetical protein ACYS6K_05985 [Planctomycetota bacterium]
MRGRTPTKRGGPMVICEQAGFVTERAMRSTTPSTDNQDKPACGVLALLPKLVE